MNRLVTETLEYLARPNHLEKVGLFDILVHIYYIDSL